MSTVLNADLKKGLPDILGPGIVGESVLRQAIDAVREGVTICDARHPELPLIYVNPAFSTMTGYSAEEILGINCRFLQGDDTLQPEVAAIKRAVRMGSACQVILRNYRRDGKLFHNELSLSPVRDKEGTLTHFVGVQKDVTRRILAEQKLGDREHQLQRLNTELERMARCDTLTGLLNRHTIDECLDRQWRRALREQEILSLFLIDLDQFKALNDRYGHAMGNACLRRVGEVLEDCFGRASDYAGRFGGDEFIVLNIGLSPGDAKERGQFLLQAVRSMALPEPVEKLTVSIGLSMCRPTSSTTVGTMIHSADVALKKAKSTGFDRLEQISVI